MLYFLCFSQSALDLQGERHMFSAEKEDNLFQDTIYALP